ncbi:hypothetical protein [Actinophytocola sp.]|uniref:hypothetical protein n=1 Tax=Actinophytocola sp. TaxID=1872138 RepID=UPI00389A2EE8
MAVALPSLPTPVAHAVVGVSTPAVPGLPPLPGSASPAVPPDRGVEASTAEAFLVDRRPTGSWAVPASPRQPRRYASEARVRVSVSPDNDVVDHLTGTESTRPDTAYAPPEPAHAGSTTTTALGPATPTPGVTPVAMRHLRSR